MMYIQKEPERLGATKTQKAKEEVLEKSSKKKKSLGGLTYDEQQKALKPKKVSAQTAVARQEERSSAVEKLKAIFRENDLPPNLVPNNVEKFAYDPASGNLVMELKNSFTKHFSEEHALTFEKVITATIKRGELLNITGIRKGSASLIEIRRSRPGYIAIRGKLGPFSKTLEFKEVDIPSMP